MAAMETKIPPSIAYTGRVRVKVTSILFLAMMCLTGIGLAISDLSKNLIFLGQGLCAPNSKLLESMVGFHGNKGRWGNMNNRTTVLVLSVVMIAAVLSGCVEEV